MLGAHKNENRKNQHKKHQAVQKQRKTAPYRANRADKKSIQEFGNNDPIAIDENGVIIEGHGRYFALKELGFKEIEVIKLKHLTEEQKKAYILAHNKLTMNTGFDFDILNIELGEIENIDMGDFGFELSFDSFEESKIAENKEIEMEDFSDDKFENECLRCKFKWNNTG